MAGGNDCGTFLGPHFKMRSPAESGTGVRTASRMKSGEPFLSIPHDDLIVNSSPARRMMECMESRPPRSVRLAQLCDRKQRRSWDPG